MYADRVCFQYDDVTQVLTYHVHAGAVYAGDLKDGEMISTVEGTDVTVRIVATVVFINSRSKPPP